MNADSLAFAVLWDSLRALAPDTVVVSHVDTVAVSVVSRPPSMWWNIATLLTVPAGWLVVDWFSRRAQKNHYRNQLVLEAAKSVSDDLLRYIRWLVEHSKMIDQLHHINGAPPAGELLRLSEHAALPAATAWVFTSRGNERTLGRAFPSMRFVTIRLLILNTEIRRRIESGAVNDRDGAKQASADLMAQSERVDRFRDLLMAHVRLAVFGKSRWLAFLHRRLNKWYHRIIEVPARRAAVTILGEDVVQRGEREQEQQERAQRESGTAGRKEGSDG
jgi:hypothetical protein